MVSISQTQIRGNTQIQANTVTSGQVDSSIIVAGGTNAFTADQPMGGHKLTGLGTPTLSTDAVTKGYTDAAIQGVSAKYSAVAGTNTETLTISSGTVTQITGTTVNGVSPNVNDYVWIGNAPAATGAAGGTTLSSQPANGLYQVTANTTNLTVARAADMSGAINPAGAYVFVAGGAAWAGGGFVVTTPSTTTAFTYGVGSIAFTQFTGAGEITVDATLTKSGNQLSRPALTGDVTASTGSNATAIASGAVTLAKINSSAFNTTPTASTLAEWDANKNLFANALASAITTTATAATTTTLTVASTQFQQFTGATTQIVVLPNATTMGNGQWFWVANRSTGAVTVNMNGGSALQVMAAGSMAKFTLINNGTTAGTWDNGYISSGGTGTVTSVSVTSANGFAGTVATSTSTPAITISTSVTGVLKGNGTAISAAATSDIVAGLATRETPTGTINGSNTVFTLANTPVAGTEMVFLNGVLQDAGAGNDYQISSATITFISAPLSGDKVRVTYWH